VEAHVGFALVVLLAAAAAAANAATVYCDVTSNY